MHFLSYPLKSDGASKLLFLASLDVDRVAKDLDFTALQDNIDHITFCNIEAEVVRLSSITSRIGLNFKEKIFLKDTRLMDPNFIKLFKLGQLSIEYLLVSGFRSSTTWRTRA